MGKLWTVSIGVMSLLVLLASPSAASPRVRRSQDAAPASGHRFADSLRTPCSQTWNISEINIIEKVRPEFIDNVLRIVRDFTNLAKTQADSIISKMTGISCSTLDVGRLASLPTPDELQALNKSRALEAAYHLLVIHTANVYFLHEQETQYSQVCPNTRPNSEDLGKEFKMLAKSLQNIMCFTLGAAGFMNLEVNFEEALNQGLNRTLADLPDCSSRITRDCFVVKSAEALITDFGSYINTLVSTQS